MGHARQHDSGDTATARRPADVEVPSAPIAPVPLPAAPVSFRPAPAAVRVAAPPSDAATALGLQPAVTEGSGFPLRRLHADRPPGQLSPDPAAPPAETGPAGPALDGLGNALKTAEALVTGLYTGVSAELTPAVADALAERLQQSSTLSALFPQVFLAGTVVGIAEDAVEAVRGVIDAVEMLLDLDELIEQATEILEIVVSPEGGELGRVLGEQIGRGWGQQLVDLSTRGPMEFTYELGKIAGPAIVYTVVSFLGLPQVAAGAAYARLSKVLLPLLQRFPKLARLAASLAKRRLPDAPGRHEPHVPAGSPGGRAPTGHGQSLRHSAGDAVAGERPDRLPGNDQSAGGRKEGLRPGLAEDVAAYNAPFKSTPELSNLWELASRGRPDSRKGYDASRDAFWKMLRDGHEDADPGDLARVRRILDSAGYRFEAGSNAPALPLNLPVKQRRLSIDHAEPGSIGAKGGNPGAWRDPANLRFMSEADNIERRDLFGAADTPYRGWEAFWEMRSRSRRRGAGKK